MCGIAGFIGYEDNRSLANKANKIQKHRGPDNQSVWSDDFIGLAHQRLSIIDLSDRSNQPFEKNGFVIVFNGEIYNFKELKETQLSDITFQTTSDTEVVLEMYLKYKENCLAYFIGMFAFAIYDKTTKNIFAARDHFGIKPFFYTKTTKGFAFASELKTLTTIPNFKKEINYKSLIASLNYLWIPGNETMFLNCYKLPPAHYMVVNEQMEYTIKKYWNISYSLEHSSEIQLTEKLTEEMEATIKRHMVADVPVSSFLSGGLDSSLIAVMSQEYNKNLSTYTIATEQKDKKIESMPDDEKYAKILADNFRFDHNEIVINADIINELPKIVRILDEPIGDPAAINTYLICDAARKKGVKVLLSGMGADEIFFGYRRMKATLLAQKYKKTPKLLRSIINTTVKIFPVQCCGKGLRISRWAKKFISFASFPTHEAYRMSYSYYAPDELKKLTNHENDNLIDEIVMTHEKLFNSKFQGDTINQMCYTDINMFMVGLNLTYSDRASMAASVEVRVPFIDKKVVELAMQIPGQFKYKNKESKYILKKVAEKYLPKEIIYRPKASFGAPIRSWISTDLKTLVDKLLSNDNIKKRGILNPDYVQELIQKDRKGKEDNAYRIYQLLTLELWFREFIDK
jgi:asparagine synthase (glutamine-hydrolysing)